MSTITTTTRSMATEKVWGPLLEPLLNGLPETDLPGKLNYAALMLNHCFDTLFLKIPKDSILKSDKFSTFYKIWNNANIRLTVDGGTNYLFDLQQLAKFENLSYQILDPQFVTGDFDSIRSDVMEHYRQKNYVEVHETEDQDHTDFTKALLFLSKQNLAERSVDRIFVFFASSGRIDQLLSIISTLYKFNPDVASNRFPSIVMVDLASSISFLLNEGIHHIPVMVNSRWCSLVPMNGPSKISTTGFRWNLNDDLLEFGKIISTSNEFDRNCQLATVNIPSNPILFSFNF